jgi:hypothetical protein
MENCSILICLNDSLSLKSQVRLKCVSKTCYEYIIIKNYSFYRIFKKLKINVNSIIKMLYELDNNFIIKDALESFYYPIENHKYGLEIKNYVLNTYYYLCIHNFKEILEDLNKEEEENFDNILYYHCIDYTDYVPLQSLLQELCNEHYDEKIYKILQ